MKFDEWFDERFGPDPAPGEAIIDLRFRAGQKHRIAAEADLLADKKFQYELLRNAALKAWVARDDDLDIPAPAGREE